MGTIGLGAWFVVTVRRSINTLLEMEYAMHGFRNSCVYLQGLIDRGEPWPDSEEAFNDGFRAFAERNGTWDEFVSRCTEYVRFNPERRPDATVCSGSFCLQAVRPELLPCGTREGWCLGHWLADEMAANPGYFEGQGFLIEDP